MKTAAAYIRVSTDDQIEYSPDSQIKAIKNYAEKNGIFLPEHLIFTDEGISGRSTGKRTAFNKMIALAKTKPKPYDVIFVWKYSRFARNREDSVVYKSMLRKQCGIDVISVSEPVGDDKMSVLFEAMIEAMDEYYSINLAEEVKRGMTEKAKRGGVLSIPPFGYRVSGGRFETVETEAEIVRYVFEEYAAGAGFLTLAKRLNSMGVKTHRGNPIENRTVEYWLNNPVYIGKIRWNPTGKTSRNYHSADLIISDGAHPQIIDDALWSRVQEKLKANKARYRRYAREPQNGMSHWLNGVLRCGICGRTLVNCAGVYYCSGRGKALCAGNGSISAGVIGELVADKIGELLDENNIAVKFAAPMSESGGDERLLRAGLADLDKRMRRIKEAYENGIDSIEEYKKAKEKINNEIGLLRAEFEKAPPVTQEHMPGDSCRLSDIFRAEDIDNAVKNRVLKSIVSEIIKTGDDGKTVRIIFRGDDV